MSEIFVDWNLDGYADLAVGKSGHIMVFMSDKTGGFTPAIDVPGGWSARYLAVADMNGDFWPDFITSNYGIGYLSIYFTPPQTL